MNILIFCVAVVFVAAGCDKENTTNDKHVVIQLDIACETFWEGEWETHAPDSSGELIGYGNAQFDFDADSLCIKHLRLQVDQYNTFLAAYIRPYGESDTFITHNEINICGNR